jgi:hypothetical protein
MTTRRESILARIKTNLDGITGVTVHRIRTTPLARADVPAIVLEPVTDDPTEGLVYSKTDWSLRVKVSVVVRANSPGNSADDWVEKVHEKIMADPTCNGTALDIDAATTNFSFYDADVPLGVVEMDYVVRYRTDREDLTSA